VGRRGGGGEGRTREVRRREIGKSCLLLNGGLVTPLAYRDHIIWNSAEMISRLIGLTF